MACCFTPTGKIHYQPALPTEREFLTQNMPVGHMMKFIITYQTVSKLYIQIKIQIKNVVWIMSGSSRFVFIVSHIFLPDLTAALYFWSLNVKPN